MFPRVILGCKISDIVRLKDSLPSIVPLIFIAMSNDNLVTPDGNVMLYGPDIKS